nr:MAG TPA: hypothetical protein [Caudoviricetes sp.]
MTVCVLLDSRYPNVSNISHFHFPSVLICV